MERDIKFKALNDFGEWVFGSYIYQPAEQGNPESHCIYPNEETPQYSGSISIDRKTLCQYIGRADSRGRDIYTGDIINWLCIGITRQGIIEEGHIEYRPTEGGLVVINKFPTIDGREKVHGLNGCLRDIRVVGNIHSGIEEGL